MAESIRGLDISNVQANLGIVSYATLEHKGTHESFTVDTIQGTIYLMVWDVPAIKAAKAIQSDHGVS